MSESKKASKRKLSSPADELRAEPWPLHRCADCTFLRRSRHPRGFKRCAELFGVDEDSTACRDFKLELRPEVYRDDPHISAYIEAAEGVSLEWVASHSEEVCRAQRTFRNRSGRKMKAPIREMLQDGMRVSELAIFFERIQRNRERISEVSDEAESATARLQAAFRNAKSRLLGFDEITKISPADTRDLFIESVLAPIDQRLEAVVALSKQCAAAVKVLGSAHNALLEIQAAAANERELPRMPRSMIKRRGAT